MYNLHYKLAYCQCKYDNFSYISKDITLALGGGGAKGTRILECCANWSVRKFVYKQMLVHLQEVFGGMHAAGYSPKVKHDKLSKLAPATLYTRGPSGVLAILDLGRIQKLLKEKLGDLRFEDLRILFAL